MSKNKNRAKLNKAQTSREYRIITFSIKYPMYYDEGWHYYKRRGKFTNMLKYEVRRYRTWKHNRKTQYK